jgi:hypothetical protein
MLVEKVLEKALKAALNSGEISAEKLLRWLLSPKACSAICQIPKPIMRKTQLTMKPKSLSYEYCNKVEQW